MTPRATRAIVLSAPILALAPRLPLPVEVRATVALLALLLAWPLALWPVWRPILRATPGDSGGSGAGSVTRVLVGWAPIALLPLLALAVPGGMGVPLSWLLRFWALGLVAATGLGWICACDWRSTGIRIPGYRVLAMVFAGLALMVVWVHGQGAPLSPLDDAYDHLATLRHLINSNHLELPGAFYGRDVPGGWDPRKGLLHFAMALAGLLGRAEALDVWRAAPVALAVLAAVVYLGLARSILGRGVHAAVALAAMLLLTSDPGRFVRGAYGGHWGLVMAWAGIGLGLSGGGVLWGVLSGATAAAVHAYAPAQLFAPLLLPAIWPGSSRSLRWKGLRGFLAGVLMGAIPVELIRLSVSASGGNPLHAEFMPTLLLPPGPVASPLEIIRTWSIPGIAAAVSLALLAIARRDRSRGYFASALLVPLVFLAIPGVFSWVGDHFGSVANKLLMVWEPGLATIAVLAWSWRGEQRGAGGRRLVWAPLLAAGAMLLTLISLAIAIPGRLDALLHARPQGPSATLRAALELVAEATPPDAVIATDPVTSYAIPAMTGRRAIVTLHQHSPPGDRRAEERVSAAAALFAPCIPLETALGLARRERATYLIFVPGPNVRVDQFSNHSDPRNAGALRHRFDSGDGLREVASRAGVRLFAVIPGPVAPEGRRWDNAGFREDRARVTSAGELDGPRMTLSVDSLQLTIGAPAEDVTWTRGEVESLPASWRRLGPGPEGYSEILVHIRIENLQTPQLNGLAGAFSKPLRRLYLERKAGGSFRWRVVELPFRGLCPLAAWPIGQPLPDTVEFTVPPNLIPGRYRLRVSLERATLYPVMTPADLLSDDDQFAGPVLGFVEIK